MSEGNSSNAPTNGWVEKALTVFKLANSPAIGWILLSFILYWLSIQLPAQQVIVLDMLSKQQDAFSTHLSNTARDMRAASAQHTASLTSTLQSYRIDELEDRRLLVEILKRSEISAAEFSEALNAVNKESEEPDDK